MPASKPNRVVRGNPGDSELDVISTSNSQKKSDLLNNLKGWYSRPVREISPNFGLSAARRADAADGNTGGPGLGQAGRSNDWTEA